MQIELICLGFRNSGTDSRIYMYSCKSGTLILVIVLDDRHTAPNSSSLLQDLKAEMPCLLKGKGFGEAKSFVGLQTERDDKSIIVTQTRYIVHIVKTMNW